MEWCSEIMGRKVKNNNALETLITADLKTRRVELPTPRRKGSKYNMQNDDKIYEMML